MNYKDTQNFKDFLELYTNNPDRVIFFVGAGLSMPLFPNWAAFLKQLVNYTDSKGKLQFDKKELLDKLENGTNFLEIADYCAEVIGKSEYREIIEKHFDKEFEYEEIPEAYKSLLTLQFKSIITTNYDRIPEIGGRGSFSCYTNKNISESLRAIEKGKKIVLKIHGDILNQDSIILTESDFKSVIHNNTAVQNSLKSLFATSTICFLGFGLNDPHFNLILDFLNSINNGQTIIHYAFLASKTKFEINSIEKKNGIRIIEYNPSNNTHPEVAEFINELKGVKKPVITNTIIDSLDNLFSIIENKFLLNLGLQNYYLDFKEKEKRITINYFTRAKTEYEQQKEILSIFKLFDFETTLIENIKICCFIQTEPDTEFVKSSPLILVSNGDYKTAFEFSSKKISEFELWQKLYFNQPYMIGNIHFTDRKVHFPFMNF
jgi:hypothetical protein